MGLFSLNLLFYRRNRCRLAVDYLYTDSKEKHSGTKAFLS
ncbi:hypothetical protein l13_10980 [Neisseria weaveri ATCC 51223]|nr:hypothetical protein l13_10980 [Neisseria weaveri ATCC 51223]